MKKGHLVAPIEMVQGLQDKTDSLKGIAIPLMKDNWVLDETTNTYKQTVAVDGLEVDSNPIIVLSTVDEEATDAELDAFACLEDETVIGDGSITFVASEIPAISFTVIAKGVMAGEGTSIADVTALVARVDELESKLEYQIGDSYTVKQALIGMANAGCSVVSVPIFFDKLLSNKITKLTLTDVTAHWIRGEGLVKNSSIIDSYDLKLVDKYSACLNLVLATGHGLSQYNAYMFYGDYTIKFE